jgi:hypothetical protein
MATMTERVEPYMTRLIDDRELQRDLRDAVKALRSGANRAEAKKRKPSRLMGDKKFQQNAQRAAASIKDAQARFRGKPPKSHRGRKILLFGLLLVGIGAAAMAAKQVMGEDEFDAQPPAS